jgi:prevent-host-death family protein
MAMKPESVSVAMLKNNLSRYLVAVKRGKEIVVTSHRHPVARIVPPEKTLADLEIIPAKKPVSSLKKIKGLDLKVDLLAELLADRRRR